jgi:hypothetical protein
MFTNAGAPCLSENHTFCSPFCIPYPALLILSFPLLPLEWLCHFTAHSHAQPPMAQLHSAAGHYNTGVTRHVTPNQLVDIVCMLKTNGAVNQALYYCCLLLTPPTTTDEALQCSPCHTRHAVHLSLEMLQHRILQGNRHNTILFAWPNARGQNITQLLKLRSHKHTT